MAVVPETTPDTGSGASRYRRFREHPYVVALLNIGAEMLPKGLYARALLIIITPIVVLEGVIAFAFMERHWQAVTRRLSEATARDIAALIEVYEDLPKADGAQKIIDLARERLSLQMEVLPNGDLPPPGPKPFFRLLDRALSNELRKHVQLPFWINTVGDQNVEIRVKLDDAILRFVATRSQTYASNSHIFLLWMVGSSVILLTVAILFLRNQIRPILRLADAADAFGKGRGIPEDFRPRGAREVRQAALAFLQMRDRIKQHVEQRTTMLAGVSHDLRTVLTRFKLELALLDDTPETRALSGDVDEMQHMLEDYLAFAKGDGGEEAKPTNLKELLEEIVDDASIYACTIDLKIRKSKGDIVLPLKRQALKRAIMNLVTNAARFGDRIIIRVAPERQWVRIEVDDDGPGIPEHERENVFRPFYRLDHARNQDEGNSGLGLVIARDIAKSHGGDIALGESSMGGLRAIISLPK
ncbi:ATP-binding protein [Hyphomicrobium sp.]|uniref:ATP-binding protein n=1 Tax=Hyphomicrobium sp. TaxID=82 RepID=UPI000FBB843E|nr:ATP-binding protein [Hyphomicrobium sp.]MBN9246951.1 HAMP domain-containing protein [Hyphomicrobium sp.]RUP09620.1 MAG: HAMP domain-containing protein [Hyphomicrobium sp.]